MVNPAQKAREDEIRRKIMLLKKEGRLKKTASSQLDTVDDSADKKKSNDDSVEALRESRKKMKESAAITDYDSKIASKLGGKRKIAAVAAKMGRSIKGISEDIDEETSETISMGDNNGSKIKLGRQEAAEIDADDEERDFEEEELVDLVASKLKEKQEQQAVELLEVQSQQSGQAEQAKTVLTNSSKQKDPIEKASKDAKEEESNDDIKKTTSGVGGTWKKKDDEPEADYVPARGSWGAFPRPRDISKAYGGGRRIGAGVEGDLTNNMEKSTNDTKAKLRAYREKVGIEVQSEKDNAEMIDEALRLASLAMQRGIYTTAVSALEKVTKFCSTNSKVGGKVFLELAMAYEASGRTEEAILVYSTLTKSRMEDIKYSARKLLYGIEAMNFMRNDAKVDSFSRKVATSTFIDTTGLANFADNFDDKYETAYVDLDSKGGFYKRLTENVVRSHREARQVLMRARGSGEVDRLRVLQALRSMARKFDDALSSELQRAREASKDGEEPTAYINGVPIKKRKTEEETGNQYLNIDNFQLASPAQMVENLNGEWRLQLLADKKGDSVKYFNTTLSWQNVDSSNKKFKSFCPAGFLKTSQEGTFSFNDEKRVISRDIVSSSGTAGFLSGAILGSGTSRTGAAAAALSPQQIISVDSSLCISRLYGVKASPYDNVKDYYCVWRKVETGTYSKESS